MVAPHTSNWDFFVGLFVRRILDNFNPRYLAKKELFVFPLNGILRMLGGYPVERGKKTNFVDSIVEVFNKNENFVTTITPEGTRSYNPNWKSGFYYIAQKANIPILRVAFDFKTRTVWLDQLYVIHKSAEDTIFDFKRYFCQFQGKNKHDGVRCPE